MDKGTIDTEEVSRRLRERSIDVERRKILLTSFLGSEQEKDLSEPANCGGVGRIRRFTRGGGSAWPENPLPIDPALRKLALPAVNEIRAQVFQNAGCNWRCWYCFVPFALLSANEKYARWVSPSELVSMYAAQEDRPPMIDLTGGQPDLVPEWVPWMMEALETRGLADDVFLWSDDNLSGDYFWTILTDAQRERVRDYPMYSRVACFKGFDEASFNFNTKASPDEFGRQFERFRRYVEYGLDVYAYVTLTSTDPADVPGRIARFVDRLQAIHPSLPLRTVPLEIKVYTPVESRLTDLNREAIRIQYQAIEAWEGELACRFDGDQRGACICDVRLE